MKLFVKLSITVSLLVLLTALMAIGGMYVAFTIHTVSPVLLVSLFIAAAAALVTVGVYLLNRQIIGRISELSGAMTRVAIGDLTQVVTVRGSDEIGKLTQNFNHMTKQLGAAYRNLQTSNQISKQEQAKLAASINGLRQGFILLDADNVITLANGVAQDMVREQTDHRPLAVLEDVIQVLPQDLNLLAQIQQIHKTKIPTKLPNLALRGRFLNFYISPVVSEESVIGCVLLLEDVTEERILARSRDEFFSIASHELRTPLTAIRGNASMMLDIYKAVLEREDMQEIVEDIHQSSMRLIDIVNDFLDISRIEQGKISFIYEDVELDKIVEAIIYEMRAVLQEKHLSLSFNKKTLGELPKVWADKNRLKQIIYNLVGNAAKFTDKGGITINAVVEGDLVKVLIIDTGRGISLDNQKLLFHKFQQAGGSLLTRDTTRGTGLGLYISKMLAENMGGHLALESSTENQGSTFSITIPLATSKHAAAAKQPTPTTDSKTGLTNVETVSLAANTLAKPAAGSDAKPGKLLIVEDDPYVLRMYARLFNTDLLTIKTALNGNLGCVAARSFMPDLILLDVMMPVMNGIEALDALKADPFTKDIPVIMLSSVGEEDMVRQAMDKGAAAYLIKSDFAPEQLQQEIQKRLKLIKKT
ncbi:MAG TPA: ATP-binding protein [Candidatus Saccharimonadales bacterium]|nr:ATP-binding protein [Candidatus Saccharimonadales bacterium]